MNNYYKELGVDESASQAEIKKAYRRMAQKYHPDREGGNAEKFNMIQEAYEVLSGKKEGNGHQQKRQQQHTSRQQEFNVVSAVKLKDWADEFDKLIKEKMNFCQRMMFNLSASRKYSVSSLSRYLETESKLNLNIEVWILDSINEHTKRIVAGLSNTSHVVFKSSDTEDRYITEDGASVLMAVALNKGAKEKNINLQIDALVKCQKHAFRVS